MSGAFKQCVIPGNYRSLLSIRETEIAIKKIKDFFEREISEALNLTRVSAPLFVRPETGLNDNLNGVERAVRFDIKDLDNSPAEIVHSLAKWKRMALKKYGFARGEGLYTDMNAIRRDEKLDNLHSIYVDQWNWEKIIGKEDRTADYLKAVVREIFRVFKNTEAYICGEYPMLERFLPEDIHFVTTQELEDMYPALRKSGKTRSPKRRRQSLSCRSAAFSNRESSTTAGRPTTTTGGSTATLYSGTLSWAQPLRSRPWASGRMRSRWRRS